jgi:hypothetical protein
LLMMFVSTCMMRILSASIVRFGAGAEILIELVRKELGYPE